MSYKLIKINTISKFSVVNMAIFNRADNEIGIKKHPDVICINTYFWKSLFSSKFWLDLIAKYGITKAEWENIKFCLSNLEEVYAFLLARDNIPTWDQIYFSYVLLNYLIDYLNRIILKQGANYIIGLRHWLLFKWKLLTVEDILSHINNAKKDKFLYGLYKRLFKKYKFLKLDNNLFIIKVFWPHEIIQAGIIGSFLKEFFGNNTKIALDLWSANEQFDFSQRYDLFVLNRDFRFYFDFIIFDRNYIWTYDKLLSYLNNKTVKLDFKILDYSNLSLNSKQNYNKSTNTKNIIWSSDFLNLFLNSTLNKKNIVYLYGKNTLFGRLLPYKCYWSKCNFCAINAQNPYNYDSKVWYNIFIDKWIDFIKKHNIQAITFKDEAIPPRVIYSFCRKLISNGLKINIQFRTRFEKFYTSKVCNILAEAWCSYCGIWLESASERINTEIANKGSYLSLEEKQEIITNFEKAGISFHIYSILWFPTESKLETLITYIFLKQNIINSNFITCTPNIFYLMKWTTLFNSRNKFNISVFESDINNPFLLSYEFKVNWKKRNYMFLKTLVDDLHYTQFLPWLNKKKFSIYYAKDFWDFIDRSYIFYLLKKHYIRNPFKLYIELNEFSKCNGKFMFSPYLRFLGNNVFYNIVEAKSMKINLNKDLIILSIKKKIKYSYDELLNLWLTHKELFLLSKNRFVLCENYFKTALTFIRKD